ncbi:MAG: endonuclease/exonuclease/phosphatase family protein [Planctomycetota bacterium]
MPDFTSTEWKKIFRLLDADPKIYGIPERRSRSVVMASWNIRKFGQLTNSRKEPSRTVGAWDLLVQFCKACDFIAIQEVQDSLESVRELVNRLGDDYGLLVSDIAGGVPGERSMRERLAFVFNRKRVVPTELASDISFERSALLESLYEHRDEFLDAFQSRVEQLDEWELKNEMRRAAGKRRLSKPPFVLPRFIQFIRSPHMASFIVPAIQDHIEPYEFVAINAHLLYGDKSKQKIERELEFKALLAWLIERSRERDRKYARNMMLFGDLNLDFEKSDIRRKAISKFIIDLNSKQLKGAPVKVNFPFIDQHPAASDVFRTNARRDQTYDHIAIFADDDRLPPSSQNDEAGKTADGYDYGMFDFVQLFFDAFPSLLNVSRRSRYSKFEYDVSDHMPIWIRLPRPHEGQQEYRWY